MCNFPLSKIVFFHVEVFASRKRRDLLKSFLKAYEDLDWAAYIDREYKERVPRNKWKIILRKGHMHTVPYTWQQRVRPTNNNEILHKAHCWLRGDPQSPYLDYNPNVIYAPVPAKESIRMLLPVLASETFVIEGGGMSNTYLHGTWDIPIKMKETTISSGCKAIPGHFAKLVQSMYGMKQAV